MEDKIIIKLIENTLKDKIKSKRGREFADRVSQIPFLSYREVLCPCHSPPSGVK